ncbi:MAG: transcriptional repressor [Parvularculaceae bacterium]
MTVYRALEGLESKGFIHKLEGLNSFVVCNHEGPHEVEVFLVCEKCASAEEIEIEGVEVCVTPVLKRAGFSMKTARLEIRGHCPSCKD